MATTVQITFDCADPVRQAEFWAEALHYVVQPPPEPFASWDEAFDAWDAPADYRGSWSAAIDPDGDGPRLYFQRVPEGKTAKNRVHLDLKVATGLVGDERRRVCEAEAARLVELGASIQRMLGPDDMNELVIVMQDPEGNEFCVD